MYISPDIGECKLYFLFLTPLKDLQGVFLQNTLMRDVWKYNFDTENELIRLASDGGIISKVLQIAPHWGAGAAASFLLWLGTTGLSTEQIRRDLTFNPQVVLQKTREFEQVQSINNLSPEQEQPVHKDSHVPVDINEWVSRVIQQESAGNPRAVSKVGARGLMQIMPATWKEMTKKLYGNPLPFDKAFDPEINRKVGIAYLKQIQNTLRTWTGKEPTIEHILAAYNGGMGRLRSVGYEIKRMPSETQKYVDKITGVKQKSKPLQMRAKNIPEKFTQDFQTSQSDLFISSKTAQITDKHLQHEYFELTICDTDRYSSDQYTLTLAITETFRGYSVGLNINSQQIGVTSYAEYWHYTHEEQNRAKETYSELKSVLSSIADDIEYNRPPMALVLPIFRNTLSNIDVEHKEKSGVFGYNIYLCDITKEPDWRTTIYGNRYPSHTIDNLISMNNDERSKSMRPTSDNNRSKIYSYQYEPHFNS